MGGGAGSGGGDAGASGNGGAALVGPALLLLLLASSPARAEERPPGPAPAAAVAVAVAGASQVPADDDETLAGLATRLGITAAIETGRGRLPQRQVRRMAAAVVREARRNGLDPRLVAAVAEVESEFDPFAVSSRGAVGVMQVMPATARWLERDARRPLRPGDLFDFERNLTLGTGYLAWLVGQFPSLEAALLAYNAGPAGARRLLAAGTRPARAAYPRRVLQVYRRLAGDAPTAPTPASCPEGRAVKMLAP